MKTEKIRIEFGIQPKPENDNFLILSHLKI